MIECVSVDLTLILGECKNAVKYVTFGLGDCVLWAARIYLILIIQKI